MEPTVITYLGQPLELRTDRYIRYCILDHQEVPLHLTDCPDTTADERNAWVKQLLEDGICTKKRKGWLVLGSGINCNPRLHGLLQVYFTKVEHAKEYAKLNYARAMYEVLICRIV